MLGGELQGLFHRDGELAGTFAQRVVEHVDSQFAAVDRREHLNLLKRLDSVVLRQPVTNQRDDLLERRYGVGPLHHEQVPPHAFGRGEARNIASADGVRALDDHAAGRLPEDVLETNSGYRTAFDQIGERLACSDRRQLVGVAD